MTDEQKESLKNEAGKLWNTFFFVLISLVASLSPLMLAAADYYVDKGCFPTLTQITGKGEIIIVCISISVSVLFEIYSYKNKRIRFYTLSDTIFWSTLFVFFISVYIYGTRINNINVQPSSRLVNLSLIYLAWTFISMTLSRYWTESEFDSVSKSRMEDEKNLENKAKKQPLG